MALVEIKSLTKQFHDFTAVKDVSFTVDRGAVLGFLGPNGAGKSTTMKMITGFLAPDSGTVVVAGHDVTDEPVAVKRRIGYLPEGAPLYSDMTPRQLLQFVGDIRQIPKLGTRIEEVITTINLESVLEQPIGTLSKGFKRRVGIAQALLHDPEVLVLDEPTDGLDPNQKHEVRTLINAMARNKAIILSTHILEEVDAVCTRAIIIARGEIVADGSPEDLERQSPRHNAVVLTIRAAPQAEVTHTLRGLPGCRSLETRELAEGVTEYTVCPADGQSIVADVSRLARERDWKVERLDVERGGLDQVFRAITGARHSQETV